MKILCGIYKIQNNFNQRLYIGSSKNIQHRWHQHLADLRRNKHHCKALQKDWNRYGETAFSFLILEETNPEMLLLLGKEYLSKYSEDRLYNYSIENHPWKSSGGYSTIFEADRDGDILPLKFCPSCELYKLSNSFPNGLYCRRCFTQETEALDDELDILQHISILTGLSQQDMTRPVFKHKQS